MKSVIYSRYGRSPHQYYYSKVVELVTVRCHCLAMIGEQVETAVSQLAKIEIKDKDFNHVAERKKHVATPKKNVEKTARSLSWAKAERF